jgi:hypothetical protein
LREVSVSATNFDATRAILLSSYDLWRQTEPPDPPADPVSRFNNSRVTRTWQRQWFDRAEIELRTPRTSPMKTRGVVRRPAQPAPSQHSQTLEAHGPFKTLSVGRATTAPITPPSSPSSMSPWAATAAPRSMWRPAWNASRAASWKRSPGRPRNPRRGCRTREGCGAPALLFVGGESEPRTHGRWN